MDATHPAGYLRLLVSIAALGLLAGLLFLPAPALADSEVPSILGANVNGSAIELFYNDTLDTTSVPATTAFTVVVGTTADATLNSVAISGAKVELILSTAATGTDAVTVTYEVPSDNPVQDVAGNGAEALDAEAVANHTGTTTNSRPIFSADTLMRSIAENSASDIEVGAAVEATDTDTGDTLTYILTGVDRMSFDIVASTGQIKTKVDLNHEDKDSYSVVVTVSDAKAPGGGSDTRQDDATAVTINVTDVNEAPEITTTTSAISKPEGTATSEILETYAATDPDAGAVLTWTLTGVDEDDFTIVAGELKFAAVPNFESAADEDMGNDYDVTVNVSDGFLSDTQNVTVTVTDVNEAPRITGGTFAGLRAENMAITAEIANYTASEPDSGDTLTWTLGGDDAGDFTLMEKSSNTNYFLKFAAVPDFENPADADTDNVYNVEIQVSDGRDDAGNSDMAIDDTYDTTITVTDVNEPPVITTKGSSYTAISEPEETATSEVIQTYAATDPDDGANLTWTLTGADAGDFTINGQGQLKFSAVPDFESAADDVYDVTVNVRDSLNDDGNTDTAVDDSIAVTVTVTNVDEDGTVSISGALSGGEVLTASVTDPDGSITSKTYRWQRSEMANSGFSAISANGTSETYVLVAADVEKYLRVRVNYTDGFSSGRSAISVSRGPIGASNSEPTFDDGMTATRTLPENPTMVTDVGNAIAASDSDSGDTLTYAIKSGNDGGSFTIDATDGQLKSKTGVTYNFESTKKSYTVVVTVHDGKDAAGDASTTVDAEITVTINLTNVNEEPDITSPPATKSVPENSTAVHTFTATDVDAMTEFTWTVLGADVAKFAISQNGVLTFSSAPDFETPTDLGDTNEDNIYVVSVKVEDNGSPVMNDVHTIRVTVTNINEAPEITSTGTTFTAPSFDENGTSVVATYTATDVDADSNLTWSVENNDFGDFTITKNGVGDGELTFKMPPNYEAPIDADTNNTYSLTVRVRDNHSGMLTDTLSVVVTVNDVNETPVVSGDNSPDFAEIEFDLVGEPNLEIGTYTYTDEDLNPSDTITWDVSGTDADHFDIGSMSGVLSFNISPNFEVPVDTGSNNTYVIVVEADDGDGATNSVGTYSVTVTVTNVDETPEVTTLGTSHTAPMFMEIEYDVLDADLTPADYIVAEYEARDEEGQTITWGKTGTDSGDFTIDSGTGVLSFAQRPNFEMPADDGMDNVYNVTVTARDTASNTRELVVTVTVTDVNETPGFTDLSTGREDNEIEYDSGTTAADLSTTENRFYLYRFEVRDEEGQDIIWSITGPDAEDFVIAEDPDFVMTAVADESAIARWAIVPDFENPMGLAAIGGGQGYEFTVNAYDGTNTATHEVFIRIRDVNERPEFTGTPDLAITYNENATIDVADYDARDEEGGVTWSLTGTDAGDFSIDTGGVVTFAATPNYEMPTGSQSDGTDINGNQYTFTVVATDVLSDAPRRNVSVDVTVTVADVEEAGTISVSNLNPSVSPLNSGNLVVFTLTDPDGGIFVEGSQDGFNWTVQARAMGGSWQQIAITNNVSTSFPVTVTEDHTGKELRAVVDPYTDRRGTGKSATSEPTMAVTADPITNAPPRFSGGGPNRIAEGGDARNVGDRMTASDRDNDTLTFGIQTSQYSDHFEINESTGQIRLTQALDFETITGLVLLTISLHDGKNSDNSVEDVPVVDVTTILAITVDDVEEEGVVTLSSTEPEVGTQLRATLADGDGGVTMERWRWSRSENGRSGWTTITGATSSNYTPVDADGDLFLRARVEYTDRRGGGKSAEAITSGRTPSENRRPTFPSTENGQRTVEENTGAGVSIGAPVAAVDPENDRLVYTLAGVDAGAFTIVESTGQLRTSEALDFETKPSYSVTVEVHDGFDSLGSPSTAVDDSQSVTITVENVEELGTVTLASDTGTIQARVPVTAALSDNDGPFGVTWQWSRSPDGSRDWVDIAGATRARYTPTLEEDQGKYIRATAMYNDGEGSNKTAAEVSPRVGIAPPVNSAPAFPSTEDGQREVAEDAGSGTPIGDPVAATDFNNDMLFYSLSGTDAASFEIGQNTGQLSLASSVTLDFEGKRSYRITVEVSDRADPLDDADMAIDAMQSVTVTVTNVNEMPVVTGAATASFVENSSSAVARYTGTDPERDMLTWTVSDTANFWISQRGQLYFRSPPSYETQTNYTVTVMAEDDGNLRDSLTVTVTVTDVEEDGVVIISPPRGWADAQSQSQSTQFSAVLDDDDGVTGSIDWQWARSSNRSSWTDISGETGSSYTATADDIEMYLRATASYNDGQQGIDETASASLTVRIGDAADRPTQNNTPQFADTTAERSVGQGTSAGRPIGAPVRATDEDPDDILTYTLFGNDASDFDIDRATGQLRTKAVLDYDSEAANTYSVQVSVQDGYGPDYVSTDVGEDATITVTITVTQVAQRAPGGGGGGGFGPTLTAPRFVDGFRTTRPLPVNALAGDAVGDPVAATPPNDDDVIYSLSGANATLFTVDEETGQILLGQAVTLAMGQSYTVNLTATDSTGTGSIIIVVIEVVEAAHHLYDLNRDGIIEKIEALAAISDYFAELIEKDEVLEVIALYFAG